MNVKEATKRLEELQAGTQEALNGACMVYADDERTMLAEYAQALDVALNALAGCVLEPSANVSIAPANEIRAEQLCDAARRLFVCNLGWLLSQTRCGVVSCELYGDQDREYVIALYDHGGKREIDVTADSYTAIIRDVLRAV